MILLLTHLVSAHPATLPHVHPDDPATAGLLAFWLLIGVVWSGWVWRSRPA